MQYPSGYNTGWAIVKSKVQIPVSAKKTQFNVFMKFEPLNKFKKSCVSSSKIGTMAICGNGKPTEKSEKS